MHSESELVISPLNNDSIGDIHTTNDDFTLFGKVVPRLQSRQWSYEEVLFDEPRETRFPDEKLDWNRFCYIENIATKKEYRGSGVGKLLLNKAEEWAKPKNLIGMSLEAQDDNLGACRFYVKQGFVLGGADTLKQSYTPNIDTTLYWYKLFK